MTGCLSTTFFHHICLSTTFFQHHIFSGSKSVVHASAPSRSSSHTCFSKCPHGAGSSGSEWLPDSDAIGMSAWMRHDVIPSRSSAVVMRWSWTNPQTTWAESLSSKTSHIPPVQLRAARPSGPGLLMRRLVMCAGPRDILLVASRMAVSTSAHHVE